MIELTDPPPTGRRMQTGGAYPSITAYRTLLRPQSVAAGAQFGASVAYGADYDGNGSPELIVGAPGATPKGMITLNYMDSGRLRAYRNVEITAAQALPPAAVNVTQFGKSVASVGRLNRADNVEDIVVGGRLDLLPTMPATGVIAALYMRPIAAEQLMPEPPSAPPMDYTAPLPSPPIASTAPAPSQPGFAPSALPPLTAGGGDALTIMTGESFVATWVVSLVIICGLLGACGSYYILYRRHTPMELAKMGAMSGPAEWAAIARRDGRITPQCRVELRGPSSAKRAHRVRASQPGAENASQLISSSSAPAGLEDVLLNVCYAPNVCYDPKAVQFPAGANVCHRGAAGSSSEGLSPGGTRVVDLSQATDALLRSELEAGAGIVYAPNAPRYGAPAPSALAPPGRGSSSRIPGGLSAVEEADREGTWGQDSLPWSEDAAPVAAPLLQIAPADVAYVGGAPASGRSTGESGAMLRI